MIPSRRDETAIGDEILALAPLSYAEKLKNQQADPLAENLDLEFTRNKTILLLGCS